MRFILKQIKIAEHHAITEGGPGQPLVGPGEFQIANPLLPYGLRTVDGSENNLQPGQNTYGAADQTFPRLTKPDFRSAEDSNVPGIGPVGPPGATTYTQKRGAVVDSQPRVISNLIVDQTASNPAAIKAARRPHRTFLGEPVEPCTAPGVPKDCIPAGKTLPIPNVTTDVGLSPPYNSWFTLFGQFFDHGVDFTVKSGGTVFVPLKDDDPLIAGPDHKLGTSDDLPEDQRFMVLTRAKNQPGKDGVLGTGDDVQEATNTDSPWVDQSQTYTSHASHQVFLREYTLDTMGRPVSDGKMLRGGDGGMAKWADVKAQAASKLGIKLEDSDVLNIPLLATDQYGRFLRGPDSGLPQIVTADGVVEGNLALPVAIPQNAKRINTAFLDDIAHNADPSAIDADHDPATPKTTPEPDQDDIASTDFANQEPGTYDDEMLNAHFVAGDGRVNENIGLTAVHQIFHSEHNRLVDYMEQLIEAGDIDVDEWKLADGTWNGERIFQAARFVTEMEYQHLVFEEFARKIQPLIDPFNPATQSQTDLNPAIKAEFAHAVYRFGHSMLTDTVARTNEDGSKNDLPLLDAFLNPPSYNDGGALGRLTPEQAAGSIVMGMTDQTGNELDEFVTETLRSNLLGLPLDLATINMTRARDAGVPSLNNLRRQLYKSTNDGALKPYTDWTDYGLSIKHPDSLVNFIAAYGKHPSITSATTLAGKRDAAQLLYDNDPDTHPETPADAADFMNSTGEWKDVDGKSTTGLDDVDLWVGGLAESQNLFGGLLGSTFNYVFEQQLTDLQNGDRLYYLSRTPGLNLRVQLEGNSFAELIMRNTDAQSLKADVFGTADCEFELKNLQGANAGAVANDPASECDEHAVLIRMADGTIRYRTQNSVDPPGLNAQSTYNGTDGPDKVHGGVDNDTFWGNGGDDRIEGNDGADSALGGKGDDVITDSAGDDNLKGGDGNDAIDGGPGIDLIQSGFGSDFTDGGMNLNETFAGEGDDFVIAGNGPDEVTGDGGDDWLEGGNANDLLQGDSGAPFFDDLNAPGNDVIIGDGGEDDYDAEGGDDIMVAGPGVERNAGIRGFDWVTHTLDPQAADADLDLTIALLPDPVVTTRDRYTDVEGLSGGKLDDILRGDSVVPTPDDGLTGAGIGRITGLQALLGTGVDSFGGGNIIMGGAGSDTMEGRGADDIIDGDRSLHVKLRVPDVSTEDPDDTKLFDSLTEIRADVFAHKINPGDIEIVRSIETAAPGRDVDTAVFSGPLGDYDITPNLNRTRMTVVHARGTGADGTDIVQNVERLQFTDQVVTIRPVAALSPDRTFTARLVGSTSAAQAVTLSNTGNAPLTIDGVTLAGDNLGDFAVATNACGITLAAGASCNIGVTFKPTALGARSAILRVTDDSNNVAGSTQEVKLSGVGNNNRPATGSVLVSDRVPAVGQTLTAITTSIADADGLGTFRYQWQRTPQDGSLSWSNVPGNGTSASFTIPGGIVGVLTNTGRRYRVIVSFTDGAGNAEELTSNPTAQTTPVPNPTTGPTAPVPPPAPVVGQALVAPAPAPAPVTANALRVTGLTVSTGAAAPLTVQADVPTGTSTVSIRVFRTRGKHRGARTAARHGRKLVATVYRKVEGGRRQTFRLTEKPLRRLKAGRYVVEVRAGTSRTDLGPATTRTIRIKRGA
jgi:Ca2+-binding RTX toxin-like protein